MSNTAWYCPAHGWNASPCLTCAPAPPQPPDLYLATLLTILNKLDQIDRKLAIQGVEMALDFSALQAEVTRDTDVTSAATTLITRLLDEIESARGDQARIDALTAEARANTDSLAAGVAAGTPADTGGGEVPPPEG